MGNAPRGLSRPTPQRRGRQLERTAARPPACPATRSCGPRQQQPVGRGARGLANRGPCRASCAQPPTQPARPPARAASGATEKCQRPPA
eukprot:10695251-Alexandrium_andersonii.AAC.1